ncbi:MAG TPA: ABC transporter permease [Terracidiphilus sp.]|jgi:putative ABC transport system permease protein
MVALWMQDLRYALRQLRRSGSFTAAVVLTLAVGIGLNAAIFTIVDCVLLRPLGYHEASRIYSIDTRFLQKGRSIPRLGGDDYVDVANHVRSIESAAYYAAGEDGVLLNGQSLYLNMAGVSSRFGSVMGVEPVAGRLFRDDSDGGPDNSEVLVANSFAEQHFGSAQAAIGRALDYDGRTRTIVGVLPTGFSFPGKTAVWIEQPPRPEIASRTAYNQRAVVRARPGVTAAALNAEMATLSRQLQAAYPDDRLKALEAVSLQDEIVGPIRPTLRLLMGSVIVVLLIVCANIGHLQLVRSTRMRRDATIRTALGATRTAIARRALLESLVLATAGCALALVIAQPALHLLTVMAHDQIPRLADVRLNWDVLLFSFLMSVATMLITALLPAWRSVTVSPAGVLKQEQASSSESRKSRRLRDALIVGEVALTLALSVASVLLARQMISQSRQDLGFVPDNLLVMDTHAAMPQTQASFESSPASLITLHAMLDSIAKVPGVTSVAAVQGVPMGAGSADVGFAVRGRMEFKPGVVPLPDADIQPITPTYFQTMGIPLLQGRMISDQDTENTAPVLVISRELAQQVFPGQNPIGQQIMCGYDAKSSWWTIVGVVGNVRQSSPASPMGQTIYVPVAQHTFRAADMQIVVRTAMDAATMATTLEPLLKRNYPQVAVSSTTMHEAIGESSRAQRFRTLLFGSFAAVAILLAAVGMYGVTAYTVAQRRFEFALRFALGAQRSQIVTMTLSHGIAVAALGIAAGVALSFGLLRVVGNLLGKLPAFDPVSYAIAILGVLAIAIIAAVIPSRRASQVEPMGVLRGD